MQAEPFSFAPPARFILETADVLPPGEAENPESTHRGMGLWHRDTIAARITDWRAAGAVVR